MSVEQTFQKFFKPEARRNGADYFNQNAVILSNKSDTHVQSYIKGVATGRVTFSSTSIESDTFNADCSCPVSSKGQLCKHMWATLLSAEANHPDFLISKIKIEKVSKVNPKQDLYKAKQAEYQKLQYQKQKLRAKKMKLEKENKKLQEGAPKLPNHAESALLFFAENGFPIDRPIRKEALNNARKKLARVFHPDVGGSHEETVILNKNYDILISFINN